MTAGLIEQATDSAWFLHDYLEHQRSADEVAALREKRRLAGAKGGLAKAANALALAKQPSGKSVPESETETEEQTTSSDSPKSTADPRFVEFWQTYPRRVGKPEAFKAFVKALKRTGASTVNSGAARFRDDPNRDDQFTPHPATWLNRDGWDDEPLPTRSRGPADAAQQRIEQRRHDPLGSAR